MNKPFCIFLIRGAMFRCGDKQIQLDAGTSFLKSVVNPIHNLHPSMDIYVIVNTEYNEDNEKYVNILSDSCVKETFLVPCKNKRRSKNQAKNFIRSWNIAYEFSKKINGDCEWIYILRPDLYFRQNVDAIRLCRQKVFRQWNLFHDTETNEIPDQIQCIGGDCIEDFDKITKTKKLDTQWPGSLHNLYNIWSEFFPISQLDYIHKLKISNRDVYDDNRCLIRGNPRNNGIDKGFTNPLYDYIRFISPR